MYYCMVGDVCCTGNYRIVQKLFYFDHILPSHLNNSYIILCSALKAF